MISYFLPFLTFYDFKLSFKATKFLASMLNTRFVAKILLCKGLATTYATIYNEQTDI